MFFLLYKDLERCFVEMGGRRRRGVSRINRCSYKYGYGSEGMVPY